MDEMNLRIHILPLGRLTLDQITGEHVAGLINEMRDKGYAGGTTTASGAPSALCFQSRTKMECAWASVNPTAGLTTAPEVTGSGF